MTNRVTNTKPGADPLTWYGQLMSIADVMDATKTRSSKDALRLMKEVGIVTYHGLRCVAREEFREYCDKEGIALYG